VLREALADLGGGLRDGDADRFEGRDLVRLRALAVRDDRGGVPISGIASTSLTSFAPSIQITTDMTRRRPTRRRC
jgi:hypothetical protein